MLSFTPEQIGALAPRGWLGCPLVPLPARAAVSLCYFAAMVLATQTAGQTKSSLSPHSRTLQRDLADLQQALQWALEDDTGQFSENCFCHQPTKHIHNFQTQDNLDSWQTPFLGKVRQAFGAAAEVSPWTSLFAPRKPGRFLFQRSFLLSSFCECIGVSALGRLSLRRQGADLAC